MKRAIPFLLILFCVEISYAQNPKIDSLNILIGKAASDTEKIKLILNKINIINSISIDSAISLAEKTLGRYGKKYYSISEVDLRIGLIYNYCYKGNYIAASEQIKNLTQYMSPSRDSSIYGSVYSCWGILYGMQSKYDSSIFFYEKAIRIYKKFGNINLLGVSYSNIAIGYLQISNFPMALLYFQEALSIAEDKKNEIQQAYTSLNIANTYNNMEDSVRAESTFLKALELAKKNELKKVELYVYTNLSSMFIKQNKWQKAYDFAIKAASLGGSMGDQGIKAASLSKAATALTMLKDPVKAIEIARNAIAVGDSSGQPFNISQANSSMGFALRYMGKWAEAIPYYEKTFSSIKDADIYTTDYGLIYKELSECYEKTGNYIKALAAYQQYAAINDSVGRKDNIRKATELTMNYEFDKKEQALKAEQKAKDAVTHVQQMALIAGLVLSLIIIAGAIIGYRNKQKANKLLKKQKDEIEVQKNNLTTSIHYAQRIQSAVFPADQVLSEYFPEHFILFKPLDIVSGDFYWCMQNRNEVFFAVGDCTGHGVPGAFMSLLGITFLNEIVHKMSVCTTGELLDQLRRNVIRTLHQSQNNAKTRDGMEIAFCRFDLKNKRLQFTGAFRPMFLVRENTLQHITGDNMPIGVYEDDKRPFTNNDMMLQKNDVVYLFSDGYVDQIGGDDRKTFRTKRFKDLLLEVTNLPMNEQKLVLEKRIEEWRGDIEQIDDILVAGIRITD
jgi:serine phosphatase RsbU (regulator of sigma subunit)